jgi:hypothetical protein
MYRFRRPSFWVALVLALLVGAAISVVQIDRQVRSSPGLAGFVPAGLGGQADEQRARLALAKDPVTAGPYVTSVLSTRPVDVSHLSAFALWAAEADKMKLAGSALTEAAHRGWRDTYVQVSVLGSAAAVGNLEMASQRFDALARAQTDSRILVRVLDVMLKLKGGDTAVAKHVVNSENLKDTLVDYAREQPQSGASIARIVRAVEGFGGTLDCTRRSIITRSLLLKGDPAATAIWSKDCGGASASSLDFTFRQDDTHPFAWSYDSDSGVYVRPGSTPGSIFMSNRDLVQKTAAMRFLTLSQGPHAILISRGTQDDGGAGETGPADIEVAVVCLGDGVSKQDRIVGVADSVGMLPLTVPENCPTQQLRVRVGRGKVEDLKLTLQ